MLRKVAVIELVLLAPAFQHQQPWYHCTKVTTTYVAFSTLLRTGLLGNVALSRTSKPDWTEIVPKAC